MEFSSQEYWSRLPFPSPGDFQTQGSNLGHLHCRQIFFFFFLPSEPPGKPLTSPVAVRSWNQCPWDTEVSQLTCMLSAWDFTRFQRRFTSQECVNERKKGKPTCLTFSHLPFLSGQGLPYGKLIFHLAPQELLRKPNPTLPCMVLHQSIRVEEYLMKSGSQLRERGDSQWSLRKQARTVSKP